MADRLAAIFEHNPIPRPRLGTCRLLARTESYEEVVFDRFWPLQFPIAHQEMLDWAQEQGLDHSVLGLRIGFRDPAHALAFKMRWG